jgi:F-type H+-transporting ATPase subunit a
MWVQFIYEYLKRLGWGYFPFVFIVFFFIFFGNCLGLVPYGMAATSYLGLTLGLSLGVLGGCILLGFMKHNMSFFKLFVLNVNFYFLLFLIGLEIISYLMRGFSLGVRLGANITAGHNLLHVLGGFCVDVSVYSYIVICFIFFLLCFVLYLEFFICGVQAYVYVVLFCIYIGDSLLLKGH